MIRQYLAGFGIYVLFSLHDLVIRQDLAGLWSYKMDSTEISKVVRHRRQHLGLTQLELADLAEVSERLLRDLESGRLTVRTDKLIALLEALGLEIGIQTKYSRHN